MKRTLKRLATVAVALPLAVGLGAGTANASHSVTVPGCYGGGSPSLVVCNLTVSVGVPVGAETYQTTVPVCVGTCQNVPVTLARTTPGEPVQVCYQYTTYSGTTVGACYAANSADPYVNLVLQAVQNALDTAGQLIDTYYYRVCRIVANAVDEYIEIYC